MPSLLSRPCSLSRVSVCPLRLLLTHLRKMFPELIVTFAEQKGSASDSYTSCRPPCASLTQNGRVDFVRTYIECRANLDQMWYTIKSPHRRECFWHHITVLLWMFMSLCCCKSSYHCAVVNFKISVLLYTFGSLCIRKRHGHVPNSCDVAECGLPDFRILTHLSLCLKAPIFLFLYI